MNAKRRHREVRAVRATRERVSRLLSRYPAISDRDVAEIVQFLRTGRHLDLGLLTADEDVRPRLEAFMEQHKKHFRLTWKEAAVILAGIAAFVLACWLMLSTA